MDPHVQEGLNKEIEVTLVDKFSSPFQKNQYNAQNND